jgi:hypothetical protein
MIVQTQTTSFKEELYKAIHNLPVDVIKIALYGETAVLGPQITVYTTVGEVSGSGYTAGGVVCPNVVVNSSGLVAYVSFDQVQWSPASFTCFGALIYNSSKANRSIAVIDFGGEVNVTNGLVLVPPPNQPTTALLRSS